MFSIIACIGKNNELGKDNELCFHIHEDMKFFRDKTLGHKVIMGHKTWDSLPSKLKDRENIVISRYDFSGPDRIIHSAKQFIEENRTTDEEIFIIGGGTVYMEFLKYAKNIYLTEVDAAVPDATTFFPEFDKSKYQQEIIRKGTENGIEFTISKYQLT